MVKVLKELKINNVKYMVGDELPEAFVSKRMIELGMIEVTENVIAKDTKDNKEELLFDDSSDVEVSKDEVSKESSKQKKSFFTKIKIGK